MLRSALSPSNWIGDAATASWLVFWGILSLTGSLVGFFVALIATEFTRILWRRWNTTRLRVAPDSAVLITGCSSGIGAASAVKMAALGIPRVFAGVRNVADGDRLLREVGENASLGRQVASRITPVVLDLAGAPEGAFARAAQLIGQILERDALRLVAVVHNAAAAPEVAPLETTDLASLRAQLEVNVVGHVALIQMALPLLRRGMAKRVAQQVADAAEMAGFPVHSPRVILVGCATSMVAVPLLGAYTVGKRAGEALAETLRLELQPWGIHVASVVLGNAATDFMDKGMRTMRANIEDLANPLRTEDLGAHYINMGLGLDRRARATLQKDRLTVDECAEAILDALLDSKPEVTYRVGRDALYSAPLLASLPARVRDLVHPFF